MYTRVPADTMESWDEDELRRVVTKKHGQESSKPKTDIVSVVLCVCTVACTVACTVCLYCVPVLCACTVACTVCLCSTCLPGKEAFSSIY